MIRFTVPGKPTPTARPRVSKWGTYYPKATVAAQLAVREAAESAAGSKTPFFPSEALSVSVRALFAYPKKTPKKKIIEGESPRKIRPDLDNLAKTVLDGMNEVIYQDDGQITELKVTKLMVSDPARAGFYVEVHNMEG